jgi:hypothetical protein
VACLEETTPKFEVDRREVEGSAGAIVVKGIPGNTKGPVLKATR